MKNTKTRLTALILLLLLFLSTLFIVACDGNAKKGEVKFELTADEKGYIVYVVYSENLENESVTIPSEHNGLPVTGIRECGFALYSNLKSITIPNSVTSIGDYAFSDCTALTSITIQSGVTNIGDDVFRNCTSLTEINFGGTKAQWEAFEYDLTDIGAHGKVSCTDGEIEY